MKYNTAPRFILMPLITAWAMFIPSAFAAAPDADAYTPDQALSISQAAIGRYVDDYTLTDSNGKIVKVSDFLGKPLVVNFIYTSCSDSCLIISQALMNAVSVAHEALGKDSFSVITIGFDSASDSPEQMRSFAARQGLEQSSWRFLSGDLLTILNLSNTLGFVFYPSSNGFDHLSQVTVIGADGKVYRQVYGENFEPPRLVDPLKELVFGTSAPFASLGDLIKKVRLFCTVYDPVTERYRFDYSLFIQLIVGGLVISATFTFVAREWWRILNARRRKKEKPLRRHSSI